MNKRTPAQPPSDPMQGIVSFADVLGVRVVDPANSETIERLVVCPELAPFESPLRERVARLGNFRHVRFTRVRAVDVHGTGTGRVVSLSYDRTPGVRLSEPLQAADRGELVIDVNAALQVAREVLPALAVLHDSRNVVHGAIAPERLVLTPQARIVIVDHVFASAIEKLQYPRTRLWKEFRIAVPPSAGLPRLDARSDVGQVALAVFCLVIGRPLALKEFPDGLRALLQDAKERVGTGPWRDMSFALRSWFERALPIDSRKPFTTALDAQVALEETIKRERAYSPAPSALKGFLERYTAWEAGQRAKTSPGVGAAEPSSTSGGKPATARHGRRPNLRVVARAEEEEEAEEIRRLEEELARLAREEEAACAGQGAPAEAVVAKTGTTDEYVDTTAVDAPVVNTPPSTADAPPAAPPHADITPVAIAGGVTAVGGLDDDPGVLTLDLDALVDFSAEPLARAPGEVAAPGVVAAAGEDSAFATCGIPAHDIPAADSELAPPSGHADFALEPVAEAGEVVALDASAAGDAVSAVPAVSEAPAAPGLPDSEPAPTVPDELGQAGTPADASAAPHVNAPPMSIEPDEFAHLWEAINAAAARERQAALPVGDDAAAHIETDLVATSAARADNGQWRIEEVVAPPGEDGPVASDVIDAPAHDVDGESPGWELVAQALGETEAAAPVATESEAEAPDDLIADELTSPLPFDAEPEIVGPTALAAPPSSLAHRAAAHVATRSALPVDAVRGVARRISDEVDHAPGSGPAPRRRSRVRRHAAGAPVPPALAALTPDATPVASRIAVASAKLLEHAAGRSRPLRIVPGALEQVLPPAPAALEANATPVEAGVALPLEPSALARAARQGTALRFIDTPGVVVAKAPPPAALPPMVSAQWDGSAEPALAEGEPIGEASTPVDDGTRQERLPDEGAGAVPWKAPSGREGGNEVDPEVATRQERIVAARRSYERDGDRVTWSWSRDARQALSESAGAVFVDAESFELADAVDDRRPAFVVRGPAHVTAAACEASAHAEPEEPSTAPGEAVSANARSRDDGEPSTTIASAVLPDDPVIASAAESEGAITPVAADIPASVDDLGSVAENEVPDAAVALDTVQPASEPQAADLQVDPRAADAEPAVAPVAEIADGLPPAPAVSGEAAPTSEFPLHVVEVDGAVADVTSTATAAFDLVDVEPTPTSVAAVEEVEAAAIEAADEGITDGAVEPSAVFADVVDPAGTATPVDVPEAGRAAEFVEDEAAATSGDIANSLPAANHVEDVTAVTEAAPDATTVPADLVAADVTPRPVDAVEEPGSAIVAQPEAATSPVVVSDSAGASDDSDSVTGDDAGAVDTAGPADVVEAGVQAAPADSLEAVPISSPVPGDVVESDVAAGTVAADAPTSADSADGDEGDGHPAAVTTGESKSTASRRHRVAGGSRRERRRLERSKKQQRRKHDERTTPPTASQPPVSAVHEPPAPATGGPATLPREAQVAAPTLPTGIAITPEDARPSPADPPPTVVPFVPPWRRGVDTTPPPVSADSPAPGDAAAPGRVAETTPSQPVAPWLRGKTFDAPASEVEPEDTIVNFEPGEGHSFYTTPVDPTGVPRPVESAAISASTRPSVSSANAPALRVTPFAAAVDDDHAGGEATVSRRPRPEVPPATATAAVTIPTAPVAPARRIDWKRTAAAAAVLVLLESAAFGAAYWYVKPKDLGYLVVKSNVPGIEVVVDGRVAGKTPASLELPPGRHNLELRGLGVTKVLPVEITAGVQTTQAVQWPKSQRVGRLVVKSTPPGARVKIGYEEKGVTPVTIDNVPAGTTEVLIESDNGNVTSTVQVKPDQTAEVNVGIYSGWLAVFAPVEIRVFEGGKLIGTSLDGRLMMKPGTHSLEMVNPSLGIHQTRQVEITPGRVTAVSLQPPSGVIQVDAPAGTEVIVDGETKATTPVDSVAVPVGTREVVLRHPQIGQRRFVVTVGVKAPARVSLMAPQ